MLGVGDVGLCQHAIAMHTSQEVSDVLLKGQFRGLFFSGHGQLGVFELVNPLFAHPRQPAFERFGLGAGNGLDQAEEAFGVPALDFLTPAGCRKLQGKEGSRRRISLR